VADGDPGEPGLSFEDPAKEFLVPALLDEVAHIVVEVQERKRNGSSLRELDSRSVFEWVINEAPEGPSSRN